MGNALKELKATLVEREAASAACESDLSVAIRELYAENRDAAWIDATIDRLIVRHPAFVEAIKFRMAGHRLDAFRHPLPGERIAIGNDLATLTGLWVEEGVGYELWIGEGAVSLIRVRDYDSGNNVTLVKGPHAVIREKWLRELPCGN